MHPLFRRRAAAEEPAKAATRPGMLLLCLALCLVTAGCGSPSGETLTDFEKHFRSLGGSFNGYMRTTNGRFPKDREELLSYLSDNPEYWQEHADTAEAFLVSPRDSQPVELVFEERGATSPLNVPWVAYESEGLDGKKIIVDARGFFEERSAGEVDQLFTKTE